MNRIFTTAIATICIVHLLGCGAGQHDVEANLDDYIVGYVFEAEISGRLGRVALSKPTSLAIGAMGSLIICDSGNNRLVKVKPNGEFIVEQGGFGFSREQFYYPSALATPDGINLYLLDSSNDRIVKLDYDLNWLDSQSLSGLDLDDPAGRATGLAVNSFGDIYVSDPHNRRIIKLDPNFTYESELTDIGAFLDPMQMTIDRADNLYIVNSEDHNVVVFDAYDNYVRSFGEEEFTEPTGICASSIKNRVIVVDSHENRVRVFNTQGKILYTFGSTGIGEYRFEQAFGVCVDGNGRLYVSDYKGNRILVYRPVGE